jgi:hypothetical protein
MATLRNVKDVSLRFKGNEVCNTRRLVSSSKRENNLIMLYYNYNRSRDSAFSIATGYGLDDKGVGVRVLVGSRNFYSPRRPDRFWGTPSLISNEYREIFTRG